MIKRLTHYGCSFAVGNYIPTYVPGLPGDIAPRVHKMEPKELKEVTTKYNFELKNPLTCGKFLAE